MKKRFTYLILLLIVLFSLSGCKDKKLLEKSEEQGKIAMENRDYEKAFTCFEIAVEEGSRDKEVKDLYNMFSSYKKSKDLISEGNYNEAKKLIEETESGYEEYPIGQDISKMKLQFKEADDILKQFEIVKGYMDVYDIESTREVLPEINARYDMLSIRPNELKELHKEVNEKVYAYEQRHINLSKDSKNSKEVLTTEDAEKLLITKKGIDLNFRYIEYMPDMNIEKEDVNYYCFDDKAIEGGAPNTYFVSSKSGDVYEYSEFQEILKNSAEDEIEENEEIEEIE